MLICRQLPNWGRLRMNADKLATFVERVCEYGAPEGLVLCQEPECKHQAIVDKIEAALQREREEAAERASEYLNTLNAREDCTHDGLRDAILGPDPQSPAPMGGEARKC
jgi:GTP-dependent phosphoenolpyruvate carboxykinase